ncbi:ABC-type Fe3+ transport system, periplasmic component [Sphaerochaeta pleomorpha str. Grapes]|uniref:ABC-type Fe3+ transport system, periplasmic component n=1 Tax=Sphaerochaeta pleomorpha (strain ATCC BAA-1885 / DSM 22778 / Grapes) TaxID=158190 RepID=G8QTD5_SPHPG|nr:ABC transporter substrate-binding protein [Sphaerochaeta pleomorpha]AEV30176.1 ABC-type Fe3+ transport system, periplasmic component [Sphaerochaeta pleomorpha str. Grapes]
MKKLQKIVSVLVLIALCVVPLFAAGVQEQAKAGGTLNVYSIMPEKYATKVFDEFTKDTGISVNFVRLSSGEALARIIAEKANPQVDALWGGPADTYEAGVLEGVFDTYVPAEAGKIPTQFKSAKGYWTGIGVIPLAFMSNVTFLKDKGLEAPTSWNDLLNPAYKNSLQMADARTSGTATERIYSLVKVMGEDEAFAYQKKLHQNIQLYTKGGAGGAMPVATGQAGAGIFYIVDALDIQQQGYDLVLSYPKEGVTYGVEASGIIKGAKNLDSAKALMDWASSKRLGEVMVANQINYIPTRPDVTVTNPALDMSQVKLIEADIAWKGENRTRLVERWVADVIQQ